MTSISCGDMQRVVAVLQRGLTPESAPAVALEKGLCGVLEEKVKAMLAKRAKESPNEGYDKSNFFTYYGVTKDEVQCEDWAGMGFVFGGRLWGCNRLMHVACARHAVRCVHAAGQHAHVDHDFCALHDEPVCLDSISGTIGCLLAVLHAQLTSPRPPELRCSVCDAVRLCVMLPLLLVAPTAITSQIVAIYEATKPSGAARAT